MTEKIHSTGALEQETYDKANGGTLRALDTLEGVERVGNWYVTEVPKEIKVTNLCWACITPTSFIYRPKA